MELATKSVDWWLGMTQVSAAVEIRATAVCFLRRCGRCGVGSVHTSIFTCLDVLVTFAFAQVSSAVASKQRPDHNGVQCAHMPLSAHLFRVSQYPFILINPIVDAHTPL
jgi:hypothetical protein